MTNQKGSIPEGQGIRVFGEKYMHLNVVKNQTYPVKIADNAYNVTLDEVHILKKGKINMIIGVKGGYFFLAKTDNDNAAQQVPLCAASLAIGIYWAVGPDA